MKKIIDMDEAIKSKSEKLHSILSKSKLMPVIKKVMHQDELNDLLYNGQNDSAYDFLKRGIEFTQTSSTLHNINNLPESGKKVVFAANHPIGGSESLHLMDAVAKHYNSNLKFLVNDLLLNLKPLRPLWVPVNNLGGASYASDGYLTVDDAFSDDSSILVYPAGLVSKIKEKGIVYDSSWQKAFISKSKEHSADYIVPVHISGNLSNKFYCLAWISRNILKLKNMGLETFYLVDEMLKQKGKNIDITFGAPIDVDVFPKKRKEHWAYAQAVKDYVYQLGQDKSAKFNLDLSLKNYSMK